MYLVYDFMIIIINFLSVSVLNIPVLLLYCPSRRFNEAHIDRSGSGDLDL